MSLKFKITVFQSLSFLLFTPLLFYISELLFGIGRELGFPREFIEFIAFSSFFISYLMFYFSLRLKARMGGEISKGQSFIATVFAILVLIAIFILTLALLAMVFISDYIQNL